MVGRGFFFSSMGLPTTTCIGVEKAIGVLHPEAMNNQLNQYSEYENKMWMCFLVMWSKKQGSYPYLPQKIIGVNLSALAMFTNNLPPGLHHL